MIVAGKCLNLFRMATSLHQVGMGDISFLAYDYCHEQISRLLPTY